MVSTFIDVIIDWVNTIKNINFHAIKTLFLSKFSSFDAFPYGLMRETKG
jgi:hypothetical protein